ncbi:MAG: hypothetical protein WBA97_25975 [Actinophytocola sp.]|uniref:hypothetical protein n=1 Tax=Actinophytocola sp. TaxID=1872138 RepID=UPI003C726263
MKRAGRRPRWRLARRPLVLQVVIAGVLVSAGGVFAYLDVADRAEDSAREEAVSVALTIADSPAIVDAVAAYEPSVVLQPFAERVRRDTGADLVTIMDTDGRRHTHPNPARIGEEFHGHLEEARAGRVFTETYTGTLGPSVRAVVPVRDGDRVVALVGVGITLDAIAGQVRDRLVPLALVTLAVGLTGTYLGRRLAYHEAILRTAREDLPLADQAGAGTRRT